MTAPAGQPFNARLMVGLVIASLVAFLAFIALMAFAPDWRGGSDGRAHALSRGATGFAGIVQLLQEDGGRGLVLRNPEALDSDRLLVVTLELGMDPSALDTVLDARQTQPTLYVLPKWWTQPMATRPGWVEHNGPMPAEGVETAAAPVADLSVARAKHAAPRAVLVGQELLAGISMRAPDALQTIGGEDIVPLLVTEDGRIVLGALTDAPVYFLADPDLLNNRALGSLEGAAHAMALLGALNNLPEEPILFDASIHGFATGRSLLKLIVTPPFLALTLVLLLAAALAGWQAAVRFGPAMPTPRALAPGAAALVDTMATLLGQARREHLAGAGYADLVGSMAARAAGAPAGLSGEALEQWLDRRCPPDHRFSPRAAAVRAAADRDSLRAAASALFRWQQEFSHQ